MKTIKGIIGVYCLGLLGIPLIIGVWECLPTMKLYQIVLFFIVGLLYNVSFWIYYSQEVGKK